MTGIKCQAKNPALCVDPQCPERKAVSHQMASAKTYEQYEAAANKQKQDQDNIRRRQIEEQIKAGKTPTPLNVHPFPKKPTYPNSHFPRPGATPVRPAQPNRKPAGRRQETTREGDPVVKFHRDLGFPPGYTPPTGVRKIVYSNHAKDEARKDRYGSIPQLASVDLSTMELVELKVNAKTKQPYRFLYRGELDDDRDICLVLQPIGQGKMMVVTNWINEKTDAHKTLRKEEYIIPKQLAV